MSQITIIIRCITFTFINTSDLLDWITNNILSGYEKSVSKMVWDHDEFRAVNISAYVMSHILILCIVLCRRHRIHRKAAVISWKLQNHKGSHLVGSPVVLYSDPPNIFNCSRRRIFLLSLFTYVHFVEQNRCSVDLFTSQVSGIAGLFLDNEIIVLKIQKLFAWMYLFAEETLRGESIKTFYFIWERSACIRFS